MTSSNTAASRAQKLRQRRTEQTNQRLERVNTYSRVPRATPPVTVRGVSTGRPLMQRASKTRPRRIFFLNLGSNVELATPAVPVIRPGWRILSGLLVLLLSAALLFALSTDTFKVKAAQLNGFSRLNVNDIEAVLKLNGKQIFSVDPETIRASLGKSFPELTDISIKVGLPAFVSVTAAERAPILAWKQKDQVLWIDAQGYAFAARGEAAPAITVESSDAPPPYPSLVVKSDEITGKTPTSQPTATPMKVLYSGARVKLDVVAAALTLNPHVPKGSILTYSAAHGFGWKDSRGWTVYFGHTLDDLEMKLAMYEAIVTQLTAQKIKPALISIENLDAPYYRLER